MWKEIIIDNVKTKYLVSDKGKIKNSETELILSQRTKLNGYKEVCLYLNATTKKFITVHSLVANAFLERSPDKDNINHKDGNKDNNKLENLEWTTYSENNKHAWDNNLNKPNVLRSIIQKDLNGNIIKEFSSVAEAEKETKINHSHLRESANGQRKTAGGFIWEWKESFIPKDIGKKKQVAQINPETDEIIQIFESVSAASRATQSNRQGISYVCLGKQKLCNNFKWSFI